MWGYCTYHLYAVLGHRKITENGPVVVEKRGKVFIGSHVCFVAAMFVCKQTWLPKINFPFSQQPLGRFPWSFDGQEQHKGGPCNSHTCRMPTLIFGGRFHRFSRKHMCWRGSDLAGGNGKKYMNELSDRLALNGSETSISRRSWKRILHHFRATTCWDRNHQLGQRGTRVTKKRS
jgi:hypothetical protein